MVDDNHTPDQGVAPEVEAIESMTTGDTTDPEVLPLTLKEELEAETADEVVAIAEAPAEAEEAEAHGSVVEVTEHAAAELQNEMVAVRAGASVMRDE